MRRIKRKAISLILAGIIAIISCGNAFAGEMGVDKNLSAEQTKLAQADAIDAYFKLRTLFDLDKEGNITGYPDEYGGCYINDENELVVCIKNGDLSFAEKCNFLFDTTVLPVKYQNCEFSVNDAVAQYTAMKNYLAETDDIIAACYSAKENRYVIYVKEIAEEQWVSNIAYRNNLDCILLKRVSELDAHIEKKSNTAEIAQELHTTNLVRPLVGGTPLYSWSSAEGRFVVTGTLGISGTRNGVSNAILTAGHVADNHPYIIVGPHNIQLSFEYSNFQPGGTGDYGFLTTNSQYCQPTNQVYIDSYGTTATISKYYAYWDYPEGAIIHKFGAITGYTSGTVYGIDYGYYSGENIDGNIYGMILVRNNSDIADSGDSGGPAWCETTTGRMLMGVLSGSTDGAGTNGHFMYISPLYMAVAAGFFPYNMTAVTQQTWGM